MVTLPPGSCRGLAGASHRESRGWRGERRTKRSEPQARCSFWNLTVTVCSLLPRISQVQLAGALRLSRPKGLCKVPCTSKSTAGGSSQAGFGKMIRSGCARAPPRRRKRRVVGSILSRPEVQEESRSFCRLSSGEAAPLRASRPPTAASPRGLHGPVSPTGALDARAGGEEGEAVWEQGRCLSPTSELFSPAAAALSPGAGSRSPGTRFEARRWSAPSPKAGPQAARAPVQARPPPAGA